MFFPQEILQGWSKLAGSNTVHPTMVKLTNATSQLGITYNADDDHLRVKTQNWAIEVDDDRRSEDESSDVEDRADIVALNAHNNRDYAREAHENALLLSWLLLILWNQWCEPKPKPLKPLQDRKARTNIKTETTEKPKPN